MTPSGDSKSEIARALYVISVAAELAGVHAQTLRIYERKGLVEPARTPGGSRRYSDRDIQRLQRIQELTNEGLNLAGVKRVLDLEAENERLRSEIAKIRQQAASAIEEVRREHRRDLLQRRLIGADRHRQRDNVATRNFFKGDRLHAGHGVAHEDANLELRKEAACQLMHEAGKPAVTDQAECHAGASVHLS